MLNLNVACQSCFLAGLERHSVAGVSGEGGRGVSAGEKWGSGG